MKKFILSIPTPCHENWEAMTPQEKGRFCAACQKTVVDFTSMNDDQVAKFFKETKTVCGRFNTTQLQREIALPRKPIPWARAFFQLTLPAFLLSLKTSAQGEVKVKTTVCEVPVKNKVGTPSTSDKVGGLSLKGKVIDEQARPMAGASVLLEGTNMATQTNDEGLFQLRGIKTEKVNAVISAVGYESKSIVLAVKDTAVVPIATLVPQASGEVVVVAGLVNVKKKKALSIPLMPATQTESAFSRFSVFPNPVASHSTITIDALKIKTGNYQLAIVNDLGVAVQVNEVAFDKGMKQAMIELKELAAGQYFVQLTHRGLGKVYTEAILVQ